MSWPGPLAHSLPLRSTSQKPFTVTCSRPALLPEASHHFLSFPFLQCTQGTKGLLESAALSPLLATSCPQGKPQTAQTSPGDSPMVNSDPSRELSTNCGGVRADASPPPHGKSRSKKCKRGPLQIPNPAFQDPVPLDVGSKPKGGGAIFTSLH